MSTLDQEDIGSDENGTVTRRTRSGRVSKNATPANPPKVKKIRKSQEPVFEDAEDLKEMSKGLDSFFDQEYPEDFEMPVVGDDVEEPLKNDSPNVNISRALGDESNGSMDGVLKTCFEDNIIQPEGEVHGIPFEPMDTSIVDSIKDSESIQPNVDTPFESMDAIPFTSDFEENSLKDDESSLKDDTKGISDLEEKIDKAKSEVEVPEDTDKKTPEADEKIEENTTEPVETAVIDIKESKTDKKKEDDVEDMGDETEVVSEDELPVVEKPEVKDAENVSDDELPGPKPADLPADTEVVSEDELPSSKKETRKRKASGTVEAGYDPGSPTSEGESSSKKPAITKDSDAKTPTVEKRSVEEKPAKKKVLPELDKYWKAVNDDATDFTGWTYLLQYVDQENDVEAAREAYDAFLSHYPYCYGYWRKYADYEKRKGSKKKCLEVLERGLRGIPLSVDLWIHYLNHIKSTRTDELDYIRQQYDRAIAACGLEFRSDRLWESYIKWETENGSLLNVTALYDKLLVTPTLGYTSHFDNFQEHILAHPPHACIPVEEFVQLRTEVRAELKNDPPIDSDPDIPPGEEEADNHVRSEEEGFAIKERIVSIRRKIHKLTVEEVSQRWNFEEGIKRPYFHVKPLERCQLKNWKAYLEWEEQRQDHTRTIVLYERCLIACALYEEFWLRLVQYLEKHTATAVDETERSTLVAQTRDVLERACTIHHADRPALHTRWAAFEEHNGAPTRAADILERLDKACPNLMNVACRRINLERRRGDLDKCCSLYESYISSSKNKSIASSLTIKYSRFLVHVKNDKEGAVRVLKAQTTRDSTCQRLYLQLVDVALSRPEFNLKEALGYLDEYLNVEGIDNEARLLFLQRKAELLEEFGDSISEAQGALIAYQSLAKLMHKKKNKDKASSDSSSGSNKKKGDATQAPPLPPTGTGAAGSGGTGYTGSSGNANYNSGGYGGSGGSGGGYNNAPPPQGQQQPGQTYEGNTGGYPQQPYHQWGPTYQQPPYHHNPWNPYPNYY